MAQEIFHEDILATTVFFMVAAFGLLQIMIGYRRWDGLALWGARVRPAFNYALGGILVAAAFAWYFSNPDHRNVRNIEGLMSVVCLVAGVFLAMLMAALLPSANKGLRRLLGRHASMSEGLRDVPWRTLYKGRDGRLAIAGSPGSATPLKVLVTDSDGMTPLLRRVARYLGRDGGAVLASPRLYCRDSDGASCSVASLKDLLDRLTAHISGPAEGSALRLDLIGVGLGAELVRRAPLAGAGWSLARKTSVRRRFDGDVNQDPLKRYSPAEILAVMARERPWDTERARHVIRTWALILALSVAAVEAITGLLQLRWWALSGLIGGVAASFWLTLFYLMLKGEPFAPDRSEQLLRLREGLAALPSPTPPEGLRESSPVHLWDAASLREIGA
ncbi:MAG: hypothetical protein ACYC55_00110 [Candidatus Geothermincolia bacterium]